ncbi:GntR family transcriptional regulator [Dubosiella newyorkensis]|uniref:GntR family transcriptional regulator n=1 Tax=Dubosiella newyorkensis TaxID=1862672 RepID=UPI00248BF3FE|nr:GntR family transcriptional regulator [Dubosiella newyorkensis]
MAPRWVYGKVSYEDLKGKIEEKEYGAGTYLPSENELMKLYDSSRDTVRKALNLLASSGYIQKEKRKGSLVLDVGLIFFSGFGFDKF